MSTYSFDLIIIGSGAAGLMAAITAGRSGHRVLLLEKLNQLGAKLKATGGGRCNLSNTLEPEAFMEAFGREGRFMTQALQSFSRQDLQDFFKSLGVETHAPDGFRIFPKTHQATTILSALEKELNRLGVTIKLNQKVEHLMIKEQYVQGLITQKARFKAPKIIIATGGMGYPMLGAEGDGYTLAKEAGHNCSELYPAMMPLKTKERWVAVCRADTIAKVTLKINLKKARHIRLQGDLIFTRNGIRGPVVLDAAREITPFFKSHKEIPILVNLTKGLNEDDILKHFKSLQATQNPISTLELVQSLLPPALSLELCKNAQIDPNKSFKSQSGKARDTLIKTLAWTPLTITGHDGFKQAMITRGGIELKEVDPNTMQSKKTKGLYFCGEILNLDGPCGGYNLQWSFSSGYLAGSSINLDI